MQNEILFLMDSSGSIRASGADPYQYWQQQIDWVQNFVDQTHRADGSNAYGIINYSGGSSSQTVQDAAALNRMNLVYGLHNPSTDYHTGNSVSGAQDKASLDGFIGAMDETDFRGGFTWTTVALNLAQITFNSSTNGANTNKFIFMLTDGNISPSQYLPAAPDGSFVSPELQALQNEGVTIAGVAVKIETSNDIDTINAMISDPALLFSVTDSDDFSNFLPAAQVAVPAPPALALLFGGIAFLAVRRQRSAA